jgi:hypothetical protein
LQLSFHISHGERVSFDMSQLEEDVEEAEVLGKSVVEVINRSECCEIA